MGKHKEESEITREEKGEIRSKKGARIRLVTKDVKELGYQGSV